jgi:hypothetical protein
MGAPPFQFKGRPYKPMTTTCPSEDVKSYSRSKRKALFRLPFRAQPPNARAKRRVADERVVRSPKREPRRVSSPSEASPVPTLTGVPVRYEKLES